MADSDNAPDPWAAYAPASPAPINAPGSQAPAPAKPDPWANYAPVSVAPPVAVPDQPNALWDTIKGIPGAAVRGLTSGASSLGQAAQLEQTGGDTGSEPPVPGPEESEQEVEKNVTGPLYHSKSLPGRIVSSGIEAITSNPPAAFMGPSPAKALVATIASGAGSEEAGEAVHALAPEAKNLETTARIAGGILAPESPNLARVAGRAFRSPPAAPDINQQFGVTQTPGEVADDLAVRSREASAMRDLQDPRAQAFVAQRQGELAEAPNTALEQMGLPAGAENPTQAANTVANELIEQKNATDLKTQEVGAGLAKDTVEYRAKLSPTGGVQAENPMEAANILQGAVANEAERAQTATEAAYNTANNMPGHFHPATFNNVDAFISQRARTGPNPAINPQLTPVASAAIAQLDDITNPLKQARDPDTGRIVPRDTPLTMQDVDQARKRLNTYYGAALQGAQGQARNYTDLNAMRQIMNAFDTFVSQKLRTNYIGGDGAAVGAALDTARAAHSNFRKTFTPQGAGDVVGPAIQKVLGRQEGQAATPEEVSNLLYGNGGTPVKVGQRLITMFGADSPEIGAVKQGLVSHIMQRPAGKAAWSPSDVADRIDQYTRGPGSTLTRTYLSPKEINDLQALGRQYRAYHNRAFADVDPVEKTLRTITGHDTQPRSTSPDYLRDKLFDDVLQGTRHSDALQERLMARLSPEGQAAYRRGLFLHTTAPPVEGAQNRGTAVIAKRVSQLLDATRNTSVYTPAQRATIKAYGDFMQKLSLPARGLSPSGPAIDRLKSAVASRVGGIIGAMIGHSLSPFPVMGELAGYTLGKQAESMAESRFNRVSKTLPLVTEDMAKYYKALNAYKTARSVGTQRLFVGAAANLNRSLSQLGLDPDQVAQLKLDQQ